MPKLKYDLALARRDEIIYGIPDDHNERGKMFLLHGPVGPKGDAGAEQLRYHARLEKGTHVTLKLTVDDGTPAGFRRVVIIVGSEEVFTGDWALE